MSRIKTYFNCRFFLNKFSVCFILFVLLFLITPWPVVVVQPCMEWIPIKKKQNKQTKIPGNYFPCLLAQKALALGFVCIMKYIGKRLIQIPYSQLPLFHIEPQRQWLKWFWMDSLAKHRFAFQFVLKVNKLSNIKCFNLLALGQRCFFWNIWYLYSWPNEGSFDLRLF